MINLLQLALCTGFSRILESPGIFFSKFKALKVLENRVGP